MKRLIVRVSRDPETTDPEISRLGTGDDGCTRDFEDLCQNDHDAKVID